MSCPPGIGHRHGRQRPLDVWIYQLLRLEGWFARGGIWLDMEEGRGDRGNKSRAETELGHDGPRRKAG